MALTVMDTKLRYGLISRVLHWGMALLFVWQFSSVIGRVFFGSSALTAFLWGTHRAVGVVLMALILIRIVWSLLNYTRRPPSVSVMAKLGHFALYVLMICVPAIALIRQYGSGRTLEVYGVTLMPGGGEPVDWMIQLGGLLHGELGWLLFVLIAGHIAMAIIHRKLTNHDLLARMTK